MTGNNASVNIGSLIATVNRSFAQLLSNNSLIKASMKWVALMYQPLSLVCGRVVTRIGMSLS